MGDTVQVDYEQLQSLCQLSKRGDPVSGIDLALDWAGKAQAHIEYLQKQLDAANARAENEKRFYKDATEQGRKWQVAWEETQTELEELKALGREVLSHIELERFEDDSDGTLQWMYTLYWPKPGKLYDAIDALAEKVNEDE